MFDVFRFISVLGLRNTEAISQTILENTNILKELHICVYYQSLPRIKPNLKQYVTHRCNCLNNVHAAWADRVFSTSWNKITYSGCCVINVPFSVRLRSGLSPALSFCVSTSPRSSLEHLHPDQEGLPWSLLPQESKEGPSVSSDSGEFLPLHKSRASLPSVSQYGMATALCLTGKHCWGWWNRCLPSEQAHTKHLFSFSFFPFF